MIIKSKKSSLEIVIGWAQSDPLENVRDIGDTAFTEFSNMRIEVEKGNYAIQENCVLRKRIELLEESIKKALKMWVVGNQISKDILTWMCDEINELAISLQDSNEQE